MSAKLRSAAALSLSATLIASVAVFGGLGSATAAAPKETKMVIAWTPTTEGLAVKIAELRGIFKKNHIKLVYGKAAATGAAQIAQILNGQINVGQGAYTGVIAAEAKGLKVQITNAQSHDYNAGGKTAFGTLVAANSPIRSFKDLEGKTVAVNSLQGNWEVSLREAIARNGGDPSKVNLVAIPFADQVTALTSGRVDAISTLQPFITQLTSQGYRNLGDAQAIGFGGKKDSVVNVTFMATDWIKKHEDAVRNWVKSLDEANRWAVTHTRQVRSYMVKYTGASQAVANAQPVPRYTTHLGKTTTADWSKLMVKYKIISKAPPVSAVQWSGAPL